MGIPATQQNDLTKEEKVRRAEHARRLMEDPMLKEAFANLKLNYFEAWAQCPPDKVHERDAIFHSVRVLADVETHLRIVMAQGRLEKTHIDKTAARAAGKA